MLEIHLHDIHLLLLLYEGGGVSRRSEGGKHRWRHTIGLRGMDDNLMSCALSSLDQLLQMSCRKPVPSWC